MMNTFPSWVEQQHKTMVKWVNCKLETNLTDLSKDLSDGLILIRLINKIIGEMDNKNGQTLYLLKPLYPNPKFSLQKLENVNDFLEFVRIVLKINLTSISGDNIVEGNLKLILGLIWSLFIFSTTSSIEVYNDKNSIIEIKKILIDWVNKISKLHQISNFNRDWSIEINSPDLILETILRYYLPENYLKVNLLLGDSRLANLRNILAFAEIIGIPSLADIDDFLHLVPDEKCILFYIIEWFKFFEINSIPVQKNLQLGENPQLSYPENNYFNDVIIRITNIINDKYEYETKSLRFSNKLIQVNSKYETIMQFVDSSIVFEILDNWEVSFEQFQTSEFNDLIGNLQKEIQGLVGHLQQFEKINNIIFKLNYDLKQLHRIFDTINLDLQLIQKDLTFYVSKHLTLMTLDDKFDQILKCQARNTKLVDNCINNILKHKVIKNINKDLETVETFIARNNTNLNPLLEGFEILIGFIHKLDFFSRTFKIPKSPSNLKNIESFNKYSNTSSICVDYEQFKHKLLDFDEELIINEHELKVILEDLTSPDLPYHNIESFIKSVPIRFVTLSSNDSDFSLAGDDDDDDSIDSSRLIFEGNKRKVGSQLSGNKDRVYDLESFFNKFEDGLRL